MYQLGVAIKSLFREKWINLLTSLTIGFALLILAATLFIVSNLNTVVRKLPERFTVIIYLKDGISAADIQQMKRDLGAEKIVKDVTFVSKEDAFDDLKKTLSGSDFVLEGLEENPLSASFELKLRREMFTAEGVQKLVGAIREMPFTEDVDYGKGSVEFIHSFMRAISIVGGLFAGLIALSIVFVIYSTIKILFYRRNDEVETYKLLGATAGFIRAPFLIEGAAVGFVGGLAGLAGAYGFYYVLFTEFGGTFPLLRYLSFPVLSIGLLPFFGAALGIIGSVVAIGRIKF